MSYSTKADRPFWQLIAIYVLIGGLVYSLLYYLWLNPQTKETTDDSQTIATSSPSTPIKTPTKSDRPAQKYTVTVTADGFSPANLAIFLGDTVSWRNKSGKSIMVSSNPHPTHTDYPPLNQYVTKNGDTVDLVFLNIGSYGYHDHLNQDHMGTIIVQ